MGSSYTPPNRAHSLAALLLWMPDNMYICSGVGDVFSYRRTATLIHLQCVLSLFPSAFAVAQYEQTRLNLFSTLERRLNMSSSDNVTYLPFQDCYEVTPQCPLKNTIYGYYPSIGANCFFVAFFFVSSFFFFI